MAERGGGGSVGREAVLSEERLREEVLDFLDFAARKEGFDLRTETITDAGHRRFVRATDSELGWMVGDWLMERIAR